MGGTQAQTLTPTPPPLLIWALFGGAGGWGPRYPNIHTSKGFPCCSGLNTDMWGF